MIPAFDPQTHALPPDIHEAAWAEVVVGILLDRIADWLRHRAWLAREIADLEAEARAQVPSATGAA